MKTTFNYVTSTLLGLVLQILLMILVAYLAYGKDILLSSWIFQSTIIIYTLYNLGKKYWSKLVNWSYR